jgi:ubiquinone/menaquinone biosynthesis C-methylase UbiE
MAAKETLWDRFLAPIVRTLIDENAIRQLELSIDWERDLPVLTDPTLVYPEYYRSANFHGIPGGYLTSGAAVSYDPITHYVLPPGEGWVRQQAIEAIGCQPRRILDLGCGTGSMTLMLKRVFPQAEVVGLDLSPYMLRVAQYKAQQLGVDVNWRHGNAEATGFPDASFDLITLALLFHETPPVVSRCILQECDRLLVPGGEAIVLDGNQKTLHQTQWLTEVFEEPYIQAYAAGNVDTWMQEAGLSAVATQTFWWMHQVTKGVKPGLKLEEEAESDRSDSAWISDFLPA